MGDEYDVLGGYLPLFVQHLEDTKARLGLGSGSWANEAQIGADQGADAPEPHTPSPWTPAEQDAFFRAVSVHSRWRPDLIAACVPTKSEWEVWMYLEALEEGVAALAAQEGDDEDEEEDAEMEDAREVEMGDESGSARSHSGSDADSDEVEEDEHGCEPALEVSQAWIDAEERMAAWIIEREHLAFLGGDKPAKRKREQPHKAREGTVSNEDLPLAAASSEREPSRNPSMTPSGRREALMARLEDPHLQVLDSILRESEATVDRSKSREGSVAAAPKERGDDGAPRAGCVDLSDRITGPPGTRDVPESPSSVVIDPPSLALSGGADPTPTQRHSGGDSSQSVDDQGLSSLPDATSQPTSLEGPQPGTSNIVVFQQDPNTNAELERSIMSPRSRRRLQKRLYMRRKRALLRGDGAVAEDTGIEKLRPGKKAKSDRSGASVASTPVPCSEGPSDAEAELPENVPKKKKPGLTLPYKLKANFAEMGVDAAYIRGQGMDLLNLGALGRLMGLYACLQHNKDEADGPAVESIDAQLIRHLQASTVSFVTDVMHKAIVRREREIRLKERSRAWRHGDQLTIAAVEHAVAAMGARHQSHKAYFKGIEATHGVAAEACSAPGNATEPNTREASVDPDVGAGDSAGFPTLSSHRDVCTPLVCPPAAWRTSPLSCLTRTYEREATRTRRGTSVEAESEEIESEGTDEVEAELASEEARDGRDMARSAAEEGTLWGLVNYVI